MYCPIILGSDKMTVSVATGHVEYHPLYLSIGNPYNTVWRAHQNAVIPITFLAIPKCKPLSVWVHLGNNNKYMCTSGDCGYDESPAFRTFKRQLYYASVAAILCPLLPGMRAPVICRCPDRHFRSVIYNLVAFIADYPEQVMLTGIIQGWCPKWAWKNKVPRIFWLSVSDAQHFQIILTQMLAIAPQCIQNAWFPSSILRHYGLNMGLMITSLYVHSTGVEHWMLNVDLH